MIRDIATLAAALTGYQAQLSMISERIAEIQKRLRASGKHVDSGSADMVVLKKRILSPAARKKIVAAQKKRWAEHRAKKAES